MKCLPNPLFVKSAIQKPSDVINAFDWASSHEGRDYWGAYFHSQAGQPEWAGARRRLCEIYRLMTGRKPSFTVRAPSRRY